MYTTQYIDSYLSIYEQRLPTLKALGALTRICRYQPIWLVPKHFASAGFEYKVLETGEPGATCGRGSGFNHLISEGASGKNFENPHFVHLQHTTEVKEGYLGTRCLIAQAFHSLNQDDFRLAWLLSTVSKLEQGNFHFLEQLAKAFKSRTS